MGDDDILEEEGGFPGRTARGLVKGRKEGKGVWMKGIRLGKIPGPGGNWIRVEATVAGITDVVWGQGWNRRKDEGTEMPGRADGKAPKKRQGRRGWGPLSGGGRQPKRGEAPEPRGLWAKASFASAWSWAPGRPQPGPTAKHPAAN